MGGQQKLTFFSSWRNMSKIVPRSVRSFFSTNQDPANISGVMDFHSSLFLLDSRILGFQMSRFLDFQTGSQAGGRGDIWKIWNSEISLAYAPCRRPLFEESTRACYYSTQCNMVADSFESLKVGSAPCEGAKGGREKSAYNTSFMTTIAIDDA